MSTPVKHDDDASQSIRTRVDEIMVSIFECEADALAPEAQLGEDLGLDSLDGVDLVVALEKTFHCRIQEEDAKKIRTLGEVYDAVLQHSSNGSQEP